MGGREVGRAGGVAVLEFVVAGWIVERCSGLMEADGSGSAWGGGCGSVGSAAFCWVLVDGWDRRGWGRCTSVAAPSCISTSPLGTGVPFSAIFKLVADIFSCELEEISSE